MERGLSSSLVLLIPVSLLHLLCIVWDTLLLQKQTQTLPLGLRCLECWSLPCLLRTMSHVIVSVWDVTLMAKVFPRVLGIYS